MMHDLLIFYLSDILVVMVLRSKNFKLLPIVFHSNFVISVISVQYENELYGG